MPSLPQRKEQNWGDKLNRYLLTAHHQDGQERNHLDVANVRVDYGAVADGDTDDAAAIQAAIDSGRHIYFPAGAYGYRGTLRFANAFQQITFAPDASLNPLEATSLIHFVSGRTSDGGFFGQRQHISNMRIETLNAVDVAILIEAGGCVFDDTTILGPNVTVGIRMQDCIGCNFFGGDIKGNNGNKISGGAGLEYVRAYAVRMFGVVVHHWETAVRFSDNADDPLFTGCHFEEGEAGIRLLPMIPEGDAHKQRAIYNLNLIGCHFEGFVHNIRVDEQPYDDDRPTDRFGVIKAAYISGCRFGRKSKRVIHADGVLLNVIMQGCYMATMHLGEDFYVWEAKRPARGCVDLFNFWESLADGKLTTGRYGEYIVRLGSDYSDELEPDNVRLQLDADVQHRGEKLSFYKGSLVDRSAAEPPLESNSATISEVANAVNALNEKLKLLGLFG